MDLGRRYEATGGPYRNLSSILAGRYRSDFQDFLPVSPIQYYTPLRLAATSALFLILPVSTRACLITPYALALSALRLC